MIKEGLRDNVVSGIFIPGSEVWVYAAAKKRPDRFVAVYFKFYSFGLSLSAKETLLGLAFLADYENRVHGKAADLALKLKVPVKKLRADLTALRKADAVRGTLPMLNLNPYLVSKCNSRVLKELRQNWEAKND